LGVGSSLKNFGDAGAPPLGIWGRGLPRETRSYPTFGTVSYFVAVGPAVWAQVGVPKIWTLPLVWVTW